MSLPCTELSRESGCTIKSVFARVGAGFQEQLESRDESKTNARDISFLFHFEIALAEPDKEQRAVSAGDNLGRHLELGD